MFKNFNNKIFCSEKNIKFVIVLNCYKCLKMSGIYSMRILKFNF